MARASVARSPSRMRLARLAVSVETMASGRNERDVQLGCRCTHRAVQRGKSSAILHGKLHIHCVVCSQLMCNREVGQRSNFIKIEWRLHADGKPVETLHDVFKIY